VPIVGDFHYNGHILLTKYPECAERAGEVPHQPGQRRREAARRELHHDHRAAIEYGKPVRIGVNWGSLDQALLTR
jgi:(E)-4-hydroxy-3-methylbut-2-enyl-diphosphate synthase